MVVRAEQKDVGLIVVAHLYNNDVVEACPLVAKISVLNNGSTPVETILRAKTPGLFERRVHLELSASDGTQYILYYFGGSQANIQILRGPDGYGFLRPQQAVTVDRRFSLIVRGTEKPHKYAYYFLPPDTYTGEFVVEYKPGDTIRSEPFQLTISKAQGVDAKARDAVKLRHVGFLEGRDPPMSKAAYRGGRSRHGADYSRFKELQDTMTNFPDSTYAKWIRFWKLYHHGPIDDALQYAQDHPDFPLSDNLMLRMAGNLFGSKQYARCRKVVNEMAKLFPDGDCVARRIELEEKLTKKP